MIPKLLVVLAASGMLAMPTAANDDFSIRFDESTTDVAGNTKTLKGNVVVEAGSLRFEADEVIQHLDNGLPVKLEAAGTPIVITQSGDALQGLEKGTAGTLVYLVEEKTLLLTDYELKFGGGIVQRGKRLKLTFE